MRQSRYKAGDKIKIVWLDLKGFSLEEEKLWDKNYRDKCGIVKSSTYNGSRNIWEYSCKIPTPIGFIEEVFYDYELEFDK